MDAKEEDAKNRQILEELLSETVDCLHGMNEQLLSNVQVEYPQIFETFEKRIQRLQEKDYRILVAGKSNCRFKFS